MQRTAEGHSSGRFCATCGERSARGAIKLEKVAEACKGRGVVGRGEDVRTVEEGRREDHAGRWARVWKDRKGRGEERTEEPCDGYVRSRQV